MTLPHIENLLHLGMPWPLALELQNQVAPLTNPSYRSNVAITTVGNGILTAAGLVAEIITRTGPTGAFTDTTDTAANIIGSFSSYAVGQSFGIAIRNATAYVDTLAPGTGVTIAGLTSIAANTVAEALVTITSATTVTIQGLYFATISS